MSGVVIHHLLFFFMSLVCEVRDGFCMLVCGNAGTSGVRRNRFARLLCFAGLLVYCRMAAGRISCAVIKILHFLQIMRFCMILRSNSELLCAMTNKCTMISQIYTLLNVSTISCNPQGACSQYLAKFHKYFKCSCW